MTSTEHPVTGTGQTGGKTRPALSLPSIVDAALSIIDDEGLAAASMRSVAASLGVQAMSLYHHVPNRDFLLEAVVDRIIMELNDGAAVQDTPSTGFQQALFAYGAFSWFLLGHLMLETSTLAAPILPGSGLALMVDTQEYPTVGRLQSDLTSADFDAEFEGGLRDLLDRVALSVQKGRN